MAYTLDDPAPGQVFVNGETTTSFPMAYDDVKGVWYTTATEADIKAAENLVRIAGKFVKNPPCSLAVIVGKYGIAHRRKDGVYVIPITALGAGG